MNSPKKPKHYFDGGFVRSVNTAFEGIIHTLRHERNMRVHFGVGVLVLVAGLYFNLSSVEFMILCFAVAFVLVAEMINTAVEYSIDLINDEYHPLAKVIKDIAAGAVFVSAINAVIIGYILFARHVQWTLNRGFFVRIKQSPWHVTLISLLVIVGLVILIKMIRHERSILHGGMPSGHTAVAFSVWAIVSLVTMNGLASFLTFLLAVLIGRSRMSIKAHTFWEVFLGGALGTLITVFLFQLLL